jgi:hypothetical protein
MDFTQELVAFGCIETTINDQNAFFPDQERRVGAGIVVGDVSVQIRADRGDLRSGQGSTREQEGDREPTLTDDTLYKSAMCFQVCS